MFEKKIIYLFISFINEIQAVMQLAQDHTSLLSAAVSFYSSSLWSRSPTKAGFKNHNNNKGKICVRTVYIKNH
jgi:hypothetical protein